MLDKAGVNPRKFIEQLRDMGFTLNFSDSPEAEEVCEKMIGERFYYTDIVAVK